MKRFSPLLFCVFTFLCRAEIAKDDSLHYVFSKTDHFEFIYHKTDGTGAGAVAAGLLGAAIQSGMQSDKDQKKLNQLMPLLSIETCTEAIVPSFQKKIESKNISFVEVANKREVADGALFLDVDIEYCGFKLTDSVSKKLSSFVRGNIKLMRKGNKESLLDEVIYLTGKKQFSFKELIENEEFHNVELIKTLQKTGKRIANKVVYL